MSEATPRPWRFVPWHIEEGASAVRAPDGSLVCTTASDEDAKLIARAANNHADLVKALQWFLNDVRFQVSVGGNPIVVDRMLREASEILTRACLP